MSARPAVMDGYIRVSVVGGRHGDQFQSPESQREAIARWAKDNGVRIAAWHEDLDRSGGSMDRPGMNKVLARIDEGDTGGIVVARIDRFARNAAGGLATIKRIHDKGARIVSVHEAIDHETPMGRAMLGLLLIMAEWFRDQADDHLATAQSRAAAAGRFPGRPAFGLRRTPAGLTEHDPQTAPILQRIFEQRADGVGWRTIGRDLQAQNVPTSRGGTEWSHGTLSGIVRNEAYLGVFVGPRGLRVEDAWEPLVSRDLWERANAVRGTRDREIKHHDRLAAGVARCAFCRYVLVRAVNPEGFVSYKCSTLGCEERTTIGAVLLDDVVRVAIADRIQVQAASRPADDGQEGIRLRKARDRAADELERWTRDEDGMRDALGVQAWRQAGLTIARERDNAETDLSAWEAESGLGNLAGLPGDHVFDLAALPWNKQREFIREFLHSVWVRRSKHQGSAATPHAAERVRVVWRDERDLPTLPAGGQRGQPAPAGPLRW